MIRVLASVALLLTGALLGAEAAKACSCAFTPKRQLAEADGAVTARLLEIRHVDDGDAGGDIISSADPTDFVFRTGRVFKGRNGGLRRGRRLVVRSVLQSTSCGLSTQVGDLTGLFLTRSQNRWSSSACSEVTARSMRRLSARVRDPGRRAAATQQRGFRNAPGCALGFGRPVERGL